MQSSSSRAAPVGSASRAGARATVPRVEPAPTLQRSPTPARIRHRALALAVGLALATSGCTTLGQIIGDRLNFHIVSEGRLYRSAQPTGEDLRRLVSRYGVKSVINLRGALPGDEWWEEEVQVSEELGLERVEIGMSVTRLPHRADLLALLAAYRELPRPILVHCQAGADRTGEAVAVWLIDHEGEPVERAKLALHPRYGHIPERWPAKLYFIEELYRGEAWAESDYDPCANPDWRYYDRDFFCRDDAPP